jgi:6-phosphogluconolactonase (cycloisomerase 2 family)
LRAVSAFLIALAALSAIPRNAGAQIYVTQVGFTLTGSVSAFDLNTTPQNPTSGFTPITGLKTPVGLAVANNNLFVANRGDGTVGVYNAKTGASENPQLITGLKKPTGLAFAANTLYVSDFSDGTVTAYTFDPNTNTVTPAFGFNTITGLKMPTGLAIGAGTTLFVASYGTGTGAGMIGAYDNEGGTLSANMITGLDLPTGVVVNGNMLYVSDQGGNIGAYKFDPQKLIVLAATPAFIKGLDAPTGLALGPGNSLFVVSALAGTVNQNLLSSTGNTAVANPTPFISGLSGPTGIAVKQH